MVPMPPKGHIEVFWGTFTWPLRRFNVGPLVCGWPRRSLRAAIVSNGARRDADC